MSRLKSLRKPTFHAFPFIIKKPFSRNRIPDPHSSELVTYIKKLLHSGIGKENANTLRNNDNDDDVDVAAKNGNVRSGIPTIGSGIPR